MDDMNDTDDMNPVTLIVVDEITEGTRGEMSVFYERVEDGRRCRLLVPPALAEQLAGGDSLAEEDLIALRRAARIEVKKANARAFAERRTAAREAAVEEGTQLYAVEEG